MATFTADDLAALARPHIQRAWFAHLTLPGGERRLHTGLGPKTIGGYEWQGVSDPFGGQLVAVGQIEEPEFGTAPYIDIAMAGASKTFLKSVWDDRHAIEGAPCDMYFAVFDAETGDVLIDLKKMFPGKLTGISFVIEGLSVRAIKMKVVSPFEGLNFPTTGAMWSPTGQRQRYAGDKGLDFINADIVEEYIE